MKLTKLLGVGLLRHYGYWNQSVRGASTNSRILLV